MQEGIDWPSVLADGSIAFGAAGFGAFVGALLAFGVENLAKKRERRHHQIAGARRVLYTLGRQINALNSYMIQVLEPYRDDPHRWVRMQPSRMGGHSELRLDTNDLEFLLAIGGDAAKLAFEIDLANAGYQSVVETINMHVDFALNILQPAISDSTTAPTISSSALEERLGMRVVATAKTNTDALFRNIDLALKNIVDVNNRFGKVLRKKFPRTKFTVAEIPEKPASEDSTEKPGGGALPTE